MQEKRKDKNNEVYYEVTTYVSKKGWCEIVLEMNEKDMMVCNLSPDRNRAFIRFMTKEQRTKKMEERKNNGPKNTL